MFKFQSFLRFHKTIGQVDAVVTFTELAIRELRRGWGEAESPRTYLENLSKERGVFVTHVDFDLLTKRSNQLHIVSLVQHFEAFLRDLGDEHPSNSAWPTRKSEEPLLEYTWKYTTNGAAVPASIKTEWGLIEYYREARNRFLHNVDKKAPKAQDLKGRVAQNPRLSKIGGPNSYFDLQFEDFVLGARASMAIGKALCTLGRPTDRQIAAMVIRLRQSHVISFEGTTVAARERFDRKMRLVLASVFGMKGDECSGVIQFLKSRLSS